MEQQKTEIYIRLLQVGICFILLGICFILILVFMVMGALSGNAGIIDDAAVVGMLAVGMLCIGGFSFYFGLAIKVIQNYKKDKSEIINLIVFIVLSIFILYKVFFGFLYKFILKIL